MRLNSKLILAIWGLSGGLLTAAPALAQSEMDLLLFEKKNETSAPAIEVDVKDTLTGNLANSSAAPKKDTT